ncbi:MAG: four helix bundle protein [Chitinophagaceae bacterium]|nr:four helix bundle protein [Chitinophagaceae bacterium]
MNKFKDLLVWQKSIELATGVYNLTNELPAEEKFGLISQIRRCVVSISSNIAEGAGRISKNDFKHFLSIALGSSYELETQLIIANNLYPFEKIKLEQALSQLEEIQKMIAGLQKSLQTLNT